MNEYLKPVFEQILPALEQNNIDYWIYGGVANAAMVGKFYRSNSDVDIFILGENLEKFDNLMQVMGRINSWKICKEFVNSRLKIELFIKKGNKWVERMSIIPAYKKESVVELRFRNGAGNYPLNILIRVNRSIDGFSFFTISDFFLKKLFIEYLNSKNKYPIKRIEDARHILSENEFKKYFPNQIYSNLSKGAPTRL